MDILLHVLTYGIPIILAITLHEAAHGYVALRFGDDTAKRLGRVSLNPIRHVDLLGTIIVPGILLLMSSPVLFGYAKPVPINFSRLKNPVIDSVYVAAAGPAMNLLLAFISALLMHALVFLPSGAKIVFLEMLEISLLINVTLAIFNMLPLLPLDGGRVLAGLLPTRMSMSFSRLEPYGLFIIVGLLIIPTLMGFNIMGWLISHPIKLVTEAMLFLAGLS